MARIAQDQIYLAPPFAGSLSTISRASAPISPHMPVEAMPELRGSNAKGSASESAEPVKGA